MIKKLTPPLKENDISSLWKYSDKIYISCICITYNHELYIRDTLDSILAQKSEYRFEIIVHDDLSTDSTRNILLEYKNKFPNIIKLILQKENQYSQGKKVIPLAVEKTNGEYICLCEGDDFWVDKNKIQKQIETLKKNKKINICFTDAYKSIENKIIASKERIKKNITHSIDDVILGGGSFMPTASIMFEKKSFDIIPTWINDVPVGDYFYQILLSIPNGAIYLSEKTIVYRVNSANSWSSKRYKMSEDKLINEAELYKKYLNEIKKTFINKKSLDLALANQLSIISLLLLKNGYLLSSKKVIEDSWEIQKNINIKQKIIYLTRHINIVEYFLYNIIKYFK